ncbi:MAG: redox-sensing transcriptional repressor Rex [Actinobacteria bacterium]|nr:MAG: redox-sensing transcriptional repressor Rex [Actinomycetota bacterium]
MTDLVKTPSRTTALRRRIPDAAVTRLPLYLQILNSAVTDGVLQVSSDQLAAIAGLNAAKVRKDLSYLGSYGTRGVGYDVAYLVYQIKRELGLLDDWKVVVLGAGNLGNALTNYSGFSARGFVVSAIVDIDATKVGKKVGGVVVRHVDNLNAIVRDELISIGVIATPPAAAQHAAELLVAAGIHSILNFAATRLVVPEEISVRSVDLGMELQILGYYEQLNRQVICQ